MNNTFLKIGHRGAKGYLAENTLESIKMALGFGVDGIEIDVHKCASGELVVFHDFTLDRITNGTGEIEKHTLEDLGKVKVFEDYAIPTLKAVLELVKGKCLINIELKGNNTAQETWACIQNAVKTEVWKYQDFIVSSFKSSLLKDVFTLDKNIPLGVLIERDVREAMLFAKTIDAYAIHPEYTLLTRENVTQMKEEGFKVFPYTVNEIKAIERIKSYGVDGIISDFPDRL